MVTASFTGLLKTIVILVFIYYALKVLFRLLAPVIVREAAKKMEQAFYNQQNAQQQQYQQPQANTSSRPKETKKVGEYIDFEELE